MTDENKDLTFIDDIKELAAIPSLALDLMAMLNDSTTPVNDIIEKIKLDQGMVSFLIKCCNSPLFGIRREVNAIKMAVNLLGFINVKSILMSYFMRNLYNLSGKNNIIQFLWQHSISVAVFAKHLSNEFKYKEEETYLAALLHDIGKLILYIYKPNQYGDVIAEVENKGNDFLTVEDKIFGINHVDTGYYLMEKWRFSEFLKKSLLYHHQFDSFLGLDKDLGIIPFANHLVHVTMEHRHDDLDLFKKMYKISDKRLEEIKEEAFQIAMNYHAAL